MEFSLINTMTKLQEVCKCDTCGNIVEGLHEGSGVLVCCGKPMLVLRENTEDASTEKHIPVLERTKTGILVKVGTVPHPMDEAHYIEWIEVSYEGRIYKTFLKPGDLPEAFFLVTNQNVEVRAYCNLHGLWKVV